MNIWYLIIFFVAAGGSSPGGDVEVVEFKTESACRAAVSVIEVEKPAPKWSGIRTVCVSSGGIRK